MIRLHNSMRVYIYNYIYICALYIIHVYIITNYKCKYIFIYIQL